MMSLATAGCRKSQINSHSRGTTGSLSANAVKTLKSVLNVCKAFVLSPVRCSQAR